MRLWLVAAAVVAVVLLVSFGPEIDWPPVPVVSAARTSPLAAVVTNLAFVEMGSVDSAAAAVGFDPVSPADSAGFVAAAVDLAFGFDPTCRSWTVAFAAVVALTLRAVFSQIHG